MTTTTMMMMMTSVNWDRGCQEAIAIPNLRVCCLIYLRFVRWQFVIVAIIVL